MHSIRTKRTIAILLVLLVAGCVEKPIYSSDNATVTTTPIPTANVEVSESNVERIAKQVAAKYNNTKNQCLPASEELVAALAANGYDARVVIGKLFGSGHAWVELDNGTSIEATTGEVISPHHFKTGVYEERKRSIGPIISYGDDYEDDDTDFCEELFEVEPEDWYDYCL